MENKLTNTTNEACNLCGENIEPIYNIFHTSYGEYDPISTIFEESMSIKIPPEGGYPRMVCKVCLDEAVSALEFKTSWENSHFSLQKYFKSLHKTEIISQPLDGESLEENLSDDVNTPPFPCSVSGLYECKKCCKPFFTFKNLQHHMITHIHRTRCRICKIECHSGAILKKHYVEHSSNNIKLCSWCGGVVVNGCHNYDFKYACPFCKFTYPCNLFLQSHISVNHPDKETALNSICISRNTNTDMFDFEGDVVDAYPVEEVIEYKCSECDRTFSSMEKLEIHITQLKCMNICDHCGAKYKHKTQLRLHMMDKHLGVRPHLCYVCGKSFVRKGVLAMHQRVHLKNKRFQCHLCGKQFVSVWTLQYHSRLHTGEKPYVCTICGDGFVKSSRLREHEQKWHIGKLQCPKCFTTFSQRCSLKTHMDRFHPNTYERNQNYLMAAVSQPDDLNILQSDYSQNL